MCPSLYVVCVVINGFMSIPSDLKGQGTYSKQP